MTFNANYKVRASMPFDELISCWLVAVDKIEEEIQSRNVECPTTEHRDDAFELSFHHSILFLILTATPVRLLYTELFLPYTLLFGIYRIDEGLFRPPS